MREPERGVSPVISVVLLVAILVIMSTAAYVTTAGLMTEHKTSQAGVIINEDKSTGVIEVKMVNMGNSEEVIMEAEHFNYTFTNVGQTLRFAGQDLQFISVHEEGYKSLLKEYEPSQPVKDKVKLPGDFQAQYIDDDDAYSAADFKLTNPYEEGVYIEAMEVDIVKANTQISHYHNTEKVRPSECYQPAPTPAPYCSLVYIETNGQDGYVTEDVENNLPVKINTSEEGGHEIGPGKWQRPYIQNGETANFHLYRFQYSASDKQVSDLNGEIIMVTMYFSNGEVLTVQDKVTPP